MTEVVEGEGAIYTDAMSHPSGGGKPPPYRGTEPGDCHGPMGLVMTGKREGEAEIYTDALTYLGGGVMTPPYREIENRTPGGVRSNFYFSRITAQLVFRLAFM